MPLWPRRANRKSDVIKLKAGLSVANSLVAIGLVTRISLTRLKLVYY